MKLIKTLIVLIICLQGVCLSGQSNKELEEINRQIWEPFSNAYSTLNYELFESIHAKDFLRISGNSKSIKSREEYLKQYKINWQNSERKLSISFRFLERINSKTYASERGIYKMTIDPGTNNAESFYGKFHVLIKKTDDGWKLIMDYDSDEKKTIGEEDYKNAFELKDLDKY